MITKEEIYAARKAASRVYEGDKHYVYLLEDFIDRVEKELVNDKVPALLRRLPSDAV